MVLLYHLYNNEQFFLFDQLNKIYNSLEQYEEKLGLFEKYEKRQNLYNELQSLNNKDVNDILEKLKNIE